MSTAQLFWGLLFGSFGTGYLIYGRKQKAVVPVVCGTALIAFPYFVSGTAVLVLVGVVLMTLPFVVRA